jgi:hypothetical protein
MIIRSVNGKPMALPPLWWISGSARFAKKKEYVRILQTTHGNYRKGYERYVAAAKDKLAW